MVHSFNLSNTVAANDQVEFITNRINTTFCDNTIFTPTIVLTTGGTAYQDLQYAYTVDGNISEIDDHLVAAGAGDQSLSYDGLSRLTLATGPYGTAGATASITYSYDELGNLTANSKVGSYTYPTSGPTSVRPHAVTTAGSNSYTYDGNGNMTAGSGRSFTYNLENKPLTITIGGQTTTFVYDGDNGRVKKVVGTTTTRYISRLYECENTNCSRMIFAGSERVATLVPSGGVHYYLPDHLGSSSVITDETGAKVQALTYYPYGGTRTNSSPVTPAVNVPYKYTAQELDASTALYNYEARQYEAALGRFVSPDTVVSDPFNPQDLNRYSYVRNNPFLYNDPTGQEPIITLSGDFGFGVPPAILQTYISLPPGAASQTIGFGLGIYFTLGDKITQQQYDILMNIFAAQKFDTSGLPVPSHLSGNNYPIIQVPEVTVTASPLPNLLFYTMQSANIPTTFRIFSPIVDPSLEEPLLSPGDLGAAIKNVLTIGTSLVGALGKFSFDAAAGVIKAGKGVKIPSKQGLARKLGVDANDLHAIKDAMRIDFGSVLKAHGIKNPDIGYDDAGNIVLKDLTSGKTIYTDVPLSSYGTTRQ